MRPQGTLGLFISRAKRPAAHPQRSNRYKIPPRPAPTHIRTASSDNPAVFSLLSPLTVPLLLKAPALAEGAPIRTPAGAWLVRTARFAAMNMPSNSGNELLVFGCGCSVSDTHRSSAAEGGQLPGLPEERMPAGLVLIHGRAHGARIAAQPAEAAGARCTPPGQIAGLAAANAAVTR